MKQKKPPWVSDCKAWKECRRRSCGLFAGSLLGDMFFFANLILPKSSRDIQGVACIAKLLVASNEYHSHQRVGMSHISSN